MKRYLRKTALLIVVFAMLTRCSLGQKWDWSKPGEHHKSVVRILTREKTDINSDGSWFYGNGVYITYGKLTGILTAYHVIGNRKTLQIIKQGGAISEYCSTFFKDKNGHDLAFIPYVDKTLKPLELAGSKPKVGTRYETVSLIGDDSAVRSFYINKVKTRVHNVDEYDSFSLSGDSGSPIFNEEHKVVGVYISSADDKNVNTIWAKTVNNGIHSPKYDLIIAFLNRLQTTNMQFG